MAGRTKRAAARGRTRAPGHKALYVSPIGLLEVVGTEAGIRLIEFTDRKDLPAGPPAPCLKECFRQLDEYFRGTRRTFSLELDLGGTPFQKRVWDELLKVPFGRTTTYRDIAAALDNPNATRAVGGANHRNPVSIIVPCHRVVGANGSLTGYGGGLWRKEWLLAHEQKPRRTP
jgi:methylated-DNA-[protein]-cysteine S-methyltransferase